VSLELIWWLFVGWPATTGSGVGELVAVLVA